MTAKELQKRNAKAEHLRVLQTDEGEYFVESAEGKICYRVTFNDEAGCTCGDWSRNIKRDPDFQCKHILAVMNAIPAGDLKQVEILEKKRPKLDERWVIDIDGNQFVKYAGLLDLAHQKGIAQIEVDPIQLPDKANGNFAICRATVTSKIGESFTDIGDAHPQNCNAKVGKHLLRLASTRAIARALRTFTNIGLTCLEELSDISDILPKGAKNASTSKKNEKAQKKAGKTSKRNTSQKKATKKEGPKDVASEKKGSDQADAGKNAEPDAGPRMSEAQKRAIYNLSRRRGISVEELEKMALESYGSELETLNSKDAASFIRSLQQVA